MGNGWRVYILACRSRIVPITTHICNQSQYRISLYVHTAQIRTNAHRHREAKAVRPPQSHVRIRLFSYFIFGSCILRGRGMCVRLKCCRFEFRLCERGWTTERINSCESNHIISSVCDTIFLGISSMSESTTKSCMNLIPSRCNSCSVEFNHKHVRKN